MVDALHHVCDQTETAQELWRVLKPGGRLVIEEPDFHTFGVKILAVAEKLLGMRSHFLTPEEIGKLFIENNASVEIRKNEDKFNAWVIVEKLNP
jgi:demethylmenaquinone methyltransferase/2-methoxy-6-polyprenyl-1,4-benzoquinol methylase